MILTGDLGAFDPAFRGWKVRDGKLISPGDWEASAGVSFPFRSCERRLLPTKPSSGRLRQSRTSRCRVPRRTAWRREVSSRSRGWGPWHE